MPVLEVPVRGRGLFAGLAVIVMAVTLACGGDVIAAERPAGGDASVRTVAFSPVDLSGRWTGPRYSHNLIASDPKACGDKRCELTYDIVACPDGWCGIAVTDAAPCGAIGLRLAADHPKGRPNAFTGKLELAKGSAPYTVEAWHHVAEGSAKATLNFVGDTGPELLLMRRSFPFHAELARAGDASCTLEKATS